MGGNDRNLQVVKLIKKYFKSVKLGCDVGGS